jgi:tetratricopeptide (TPR) repeat protein
MQTISIREQQKTDTGFDAILSFNGGSEYSIHITDPFAAEQEKHLEWYFEEYLRFPWVDTVKAEQAAFSVRTYGEQLFQQIFRSNFNAYSEYQQIRNPLSQLQIEIVGKTTEFQALHWEALWDSDLPRPLAIECLMFRKRIQPTPVRANVQSSPAINLLVVTARPKEEKDVAYRTISRPLFQAIQNSQLKVNVDLLRPGTYKALEEHLTAKGEGYYHVIHFDAHGVLAAFDQLQQENHGDQYFFRYGRPELESFQGIKAFLFLEGEEKGKADPIEASELADLLISRGIPICILNACQSGKQLKESQDQRETSLGSRLMAAGMQMVVAMGYSITVSAAAKLMERVYTELFAGKRIAEAVRLGRRELFMDKKRRAYFNQSINLEDWLLPVVYSNQALNLNLREFTPEEEEEWFKRDSGIYQFPEPEYGFVGRDLEILKIERALIRNNILLLRGMGGTGKTTLLNFLREWWQRTNFAKDVFYFGYDQKAWTLEQILFEIGQQVYDNKFEQARFQAMSHEAQVQKLVTTLRAEYYVLILDNLESITGEPLAIQNTLPEIERNKIRDFVAKLGVVSGKTGKTYVVLGSRSGEEWLKAKTFKSNVYELQGLDPESRSILAERILEAHVEEERIPEIRKDTAFTRLIKVLAGYPLALEVVLPNLTNQSPTQLLEALQAADVDLDKEKSEDKTKSILKCVDYSHSNLSPEFQNLLLCLAPFNGFIERSYLVEYISHLQKLEPFKDYAFDKFDDAIQQAINWGLLSPASQTELAVPDGASWQPLNIQPVFPYFLKVKLNQLSADTYQALKIGFKDFYRERANYYEELMNSDIPGHLQFGIKACILEYENLFSALQNCLENHEEISIFFCLDKYFSITSNPKNGLQLAETVCKALDSYPSTFKDTEFGYQVGLAVERMALGYFKTKKNILARQAYQKVLEIYESILVSDSFAIFFEEAFGAFYSEPQSSAFASQFYGVKGKLDYRQKKCWLALTYHHLGRVAQEMREFDEARRNYQQALEIFDEIGDRYAPAHVYHSLGRTAQELGEFEEARSNYRKANQIFKEFDDLYNQARSFHYSKGLYPPEEREWELAIENYQQALKKFEEFGDRYNQGHTYYRLGLIAKELGDFEEARRNYQEALEVFIEFNDLYEQASMYWQFGLLAEAQKNSLPKDARVEELVEEAKANFRKALELFTDFKDTYRMREVKLALERFSSGFESQGDEFMSLDSESLGEE